MALERRLQRLAADLRALRRAPAADPEAPVRFALRRRGLRWREGRTEKKLDPTDPTLPVTTEKPDTAVTSPSDGETSKPFEHDFLGQLRKNGRRNQEYTWDFFGRLTKVCEGQEGSCGAVATYRYDALNRRVEKVVEAPYPAWDRVTQFYHDGWRAIEERAIELEGTPQQEVEYVRARCGFGVVISTDSRRPVREWVRTVLVGSDGGIVFAMLKQVVSGPIDERMAIAIPDEEALDEVWKKNQKQQAPLENLVLSMVKELAKLNPQSHVHAAELYAAVNVIRRCPPGPILSILASKPWFSHVGDQHFRLSEIE